jgi:DNA-binding GntR family transcriptional regulator
MSLHLLPETAPGTAHEAAADAAELVLVDVATGRWLPGDEVDPLVVAREHGLAPHVVLAALGDLRRLGLLARSPFTGASVVVWHRRANEVLMRRLALALADVADLAPVLGELPEPAPTGPCVAARHGFELPADVAHLLDLARTMLAALPSGEGSRVVADVVRPLSVLATRTAMRVHGVEPALPEQVRGEIVDLVEAAAHYGEWSSVPGLVADYSVAFGADEPRA